MNKKKIITMILTAILLQNSVFAQSWIMEKYSCENKTYVMHSLQKEVYLCTTCNKHQSCIRNGDMKWYYENNIADMFFLEGSAISTSPRISKLIMNTKHPINADKLEYGAFV